MIRPSALQMAEHCGLSAQLGEQFPEQSDAAARGTAIHAEIAARAPVTGEAAAAVAALDGVTGKVELEVAVELHDPETGELITAGTADVVIDDGTTVTIWDWKTGRPEFVTEAAGNMQLHSYALAVALQRGRDAYAVRAVFLDSDGAHPSEASAVAGAEMWTMLNRIKAAAARPAVATPGEHCARCWSRVHCHAWRDRVSTSLALIHASASSDLQLTDETATALALRLADVKKAAEAAEDMVKAHVRAGGRVEHDGKVYAPTQVAGRKTADVKALEAAGLHEYMKQGAGYEIWKWRRA